jgi:hypothetical protein
VIVLNQKSAQKLLESNGWTMVRGGKHVVKMTKPGQRRSRFRTTRTATIRPA